MSNKPRSEVGWATPGFKTGGMGAQFRGIMPHRTDTHTLRVRITEEPERYCVDERHFCFAVSDRTAVYEGRVESAATFWKESHPNARLAAEAECARLNAQTERTPEPQ